MADAAQSIDVNLQSDPVTRGNDILRDLDRLRETEPVFWSDQSFCWIVTPHADVSDMFKGKYPLINSGRNDYLYRMIPEDEWPEKIGNIIKFFKSAVVSLDGSDHKRIRTLLMKAFTRKVVESHRDYARGRAQHLIDFAIDNSPIEFNEQISRPMTADVLFRFIGMPDSMFPKLREWTTAVAEGLTSAAPSVEQLVRCNSTIDEMNNAIMEEIELRRREPREDLLTSMLNAEEGGDRLTIEEILAQMNLLIVAGHDTTMNTITLGVEALSRHPGALDYIQEHPDKIDQCVAELQRYVSMATAQPRLVAEDFELHGKHIKKGQMVMIMHGIANRDGEVFDNPEELDFSRDNRNSMTFAPGVHFCLGHLLAKMQLAEFFGTLANKAKGVESLDEQLDFMPTVVFRGLYKMNVKITPR